MHAIRGRSLQLVRSLPRQQLPILGWQSLEKGLLWQRGVFHVGATPQPLVVQHCNDRSEAGVDDECRARIAVALKVIVDVRRNEALRPCDAVKGETEQAPHRAARTIGADHPPAAQLFRRAPGGDGECDSLRILMQVLKARPKTYAR